MQSFDGGTVGPQGSWYPLNLVVSGCRIDLSEALLQDLVEIFENTIFLRVVGVSFMVLDHEVSQQCDVYLINEVGSLVTGEASRAPKSSDDILEDELGSSVSNVIFNWCSFDPKGETICSSNNVPSM